MKIKALIVILLLMSAYNLFAQGGKIIDSAQNLYNKKDYVGAFNLLSKGIAETKNPYHNVIYDVACYASKADLKDTAFYYLNRLLIVGEYDMILTDAANDSDFVNIKKDNDRWGNFLNRANKLKAGEEIKEMSSIVTCVKYGDSLFNFTESDTKSDLEKIPTQDLPKAINKLNKFPFIKRASKNELINFAAKINDGTYSFYNVQLPYDYDNKKSYPLLIVLHGGVFMNLGFGNPYTLSRDGQYDTTGINQFFSRFGYATNTIVVYPHANWEYNWMSSNAGFPMIPNIVKDLKHYFNIDDDKVFLAGHSNGATGVISYLLKEPSCFAGFYGFNSNPRIWTGGTFIKNALNRSYFNEATDKDYYFPVSGHDTLAAIAKRLGIDWQNHVYKGFPHWFPQFKESKPAFELMFSDMAARKRNSFKNDLFWECDDVNFGKCDWIQIDALDTLSAKKDWQTEINFPTTHWINNFDTSKVSDTTVMAFNFPRLSGAVKAHFKNNGFDIETSRVKSITVFLSPEMIDFSKPILVKVNGKILFNQKIGYNRDFILQTFFESFDRAQIFVNKIDINIDY